MNSLIGIILAGIVIVMVPVILVWVIFAESIGYLLE